MEFVNRSHIFEKAEVGIALNDPDAGKVGTVNERYAELMGYDQDTLADMTIEEISADDPSFDQAEAMQKIQQALDGEPQQFDWLFERADGSQFWGEVVLKRMMLGEHDRLVAFVRDISERKQYEQELERHNQRLKEFASIVSHDLRNPLNVAGGRLELIREECDSEHIDEIEAAHQRMYELIEDLLTLVKDDGDAVDQEIVHLPTVVKSCWSMVDTKSAEIDVKTTETIQADHQRLQQLMENLFRNAVEHGGADVTVTVGDFSDGFFVEDDGPGIPEAKREQVFETGYTTSSEGTGVGLSIVQDIADAMDWELCVTESPADGARFEFAGVQKPET